MIGYWGYLNFLVNHNWMQCPANIKRTAAARFDKSYPANTEDRPRLTFMGAEVGQFTFTMHLDQRFYAGGNIRDLLAEIVKWVNEGYAGELVIGTRSYGHNKWVCTKLSETFNEVIHDGILVAADIEITLEEI